MTLKEFRVQTADLSEDAQLVVCQINPDPSILEDPVGRDDIGYMVHGTIGGTEVVELWLN